MNIIYFLVIVIIFMIVLIVLWHVHNNKLYNPAYDTVWEPEDKYEDIFIGNVNAWHIHNYDDRPVVLYCHGNNANISYREYIYNMCKGFKFNLLLFDYRGFGKSKGFPSQTNIYKDGEDVYYWLIKRYHPHKIIVWGESLGGAVATYIASKYVCRCLILFSTFSSLDEIIMEGSWYPLWFKWIARTTSWYLDTLPSKCYITNVTEPTILIHSKDDNVIPISNAYKLYKNIIHRNKEFITIKGHHTDPILNTKQFAQLYEFCLKSNACDKSYNDTNSDYFNLNIENIMDSMSKGAQKCKNFSS